MAQKALNYKFLLILTFMGLLIAIFSALESRVEWLATFCGLFGDGCRETDNFTLFRVPVALWGIGYYVLLALAIYLAGPLVFWLVMAGFGMEITFIWTLVYMKWMCIFCLLNFAVVALLFAFSFEKTRAWQSFSIVLLLFVSSYHVLFYENRLSHPINTDKQNPSVAAQVAGQEITTQELDQPLNSRIYGLQKEMYRLRQERLDEMIDKILLQKEADRHRIPLQQFINNTILSDNITATDEEIDLYYQQNQNRWANWNGSQEELRTRIRSHVEGQKAYSSIVKYARSLRNQYDVKVSLKEPPLPFTKVSIGDSPVLGPSDAPVTVVEFSDYLCPACRMSHQIIHQVREAYEGRIRWVFKDLPLDRHKGAKKLAEAARCAGEQGKFWEYQDLLFGSKNEVDRDQAKQYAEQLGLDVDRFNQCYDSGQYASEIEKDLEEARQAGVSATPTFIINGQLSSGAPPFEKFKELIDKELEKAKPSQSNS